MANSLSEYWSDKYVESKAELIKGQKVIETLADMIIDLQDENKELKIALEKEKKVNNLLIKSKKVSVIKIKRVETKKRPVTAVTKRRG